LQSHYAFESKFTFPSEKAPVLFHFFHPQSPSTKIHRGVWPIFTSVNFQMGRDMAQRRGPGLKVIQCRSGKNMSRLHPTQTLADADKGTVSAWFCSWFGDEGEN
jgi:hypothetical protein